jgi:hypothetical protein
LDSETKLQLAAIALQALDWRCKHLTERLRSCLFVMTLRDTYAPAFEKYSVPHRQVSPDNMNKLLTMNNRSFQDSSSPHRSPQISGDKSAFSSSSGQLRTPSTRHLCCNARATSPCLTTMQDRNRATASSSIIINRFLLLWCTLESSFLTTVFMFLFLQHSPEARAFSSTSPSLVWARKLAIKS